MDLGFTIFAKTSTSGAVIGIRRTIMRSHRSATRAAPNQALAALPAEAPGAITSRSRVAPPAPASRRDFSTPIMGSGSRAIYEAVVGLDYWPGENIASAQNRVSIPANATSLR